MHAPQDRSLHSDLPEAVPEKSEIESYKFSAPDRSAPYSSVQAVPIPTTADATSPTTIYGESEKPAASRWTRWPLLLLYGLLLAIAAGLIGGFIGKAIESNNHKSNVSVQDASQNASCATPTTVSGSMGSSVPSSAPSATTSTAATPSSTLFSRLDVQPLSGCDSSAPYRTFKSRAIYTKAQYTTICGQGWLQDDLISLSAATPSDCIEACISYNAHKGTTERMCVGGGYIPEWWNQTRAMVESGITPFNCFLKSNTTGIARNDQKFEVIALCVEDECDGVTG